MDILQPAGLPAVEQIDQRQAPRVLFRHKGLFIAGSARHAVRTEDISLLGLSFFIDTPLPAGLLCAVEMKSFLVPAPITLSGEVVYCILSGLKGYRIGMKYPRLAPALQNQINRMLSLVQI